MTSTPMADSNWTVSLNHMGSHYEYKLRTLISALDKKTSLIVRWSDDADPHVVLHDKPLMVKKQMSNLAAAP